MSIQRKIIPVLRVIIAWKYPHLSVFSCSLSLTTTALVSFVFLELL